METRMACSSAVGGSSVANWLSRRLGGMKWPLRPPRRLAMVGLGALQEDEGDRAAGGGADAVAIDAASAPSRRSPPRRRHRESPRRWHRATASGRHPPAARRRSSWRCWQAGETRRRRGRAGRSAAPRRAPTVDLPLPDDPHHHDRGVRLAHRLPLVFVAPSIARRGRGREA